MKKKLILLHMWAKALASQPKSCDEEGDQGRVDRELGYRRLISFGVNPPAHASWQALLTDEKSDDSVTDARNSFSTQTRLITGKPCVSVGSLSYAFERRLRVAGDGHSPVESESDKSETALLNEDSILNDALLVSTHDIRDTLATIRYHNSRFNSGHRHDGIFNSTTSNQGSWYMEHMCDSDYVRAKSTDQSDIVNRLPMDVTGSELPYDSFRDMIAASQLRRINSISTDSETQSVSPNISDADDAHDIESQPRPRRSPVLYQHPLHQQHFLDRFAISAIAHWLCVENNAPICRYLVCCREVRALVAVLASFAILYVVVSIMEALISLG